MTEKEKCIHCTWTIDKSTGYGRKNVAGKKLYEHRELFKKFFPAKDIAKKILHHKCENRWCINIEHLKAVTSKEHKAIHGASGVCKLNKNKTKCFCGREYSKNRQGFRVCVPCAKEASRKWKREHKRDRSIERKL